MNHTRLAGSLSSHRTSMLLLTCLWASVGAGCGVQIVTSRDAHAPPDTGPLTDAASLPDGGLDTGIDAGSDGGFDTGIDAGSDGGFDAGFDAGFDGGADAGLDTGIDGGADAAPSLDGGPPPGSVDLRTCATFAVLAGSTITNTGLTIVTGDMGLSPGSGIVGFPPGVLIGTLHVTDSVAAQAVLDLTTAFNDAAGRTTAPTTLIGDIGGMTLAAGLYKSTSGMAISVGDVTLDGGGDPNAVFIFQMSTTFVVGSSRQVILIGGAQPNNVYWQVGSSATVGTGAMMVGTILADQSIAFATGASLRGRALTRIGGVTMDDNAITLP